MNTVFEKLLLSELRISVYDAARTSEDSCDPHEPKQDPTPQALTDERIVQAMTVNEELRNLGYTLKPEDILRLAGSPSLTSFAKDFRSLLPDVTALPMYPDFPRQVMEMNEAEFRLHQMIHYFSTYNLEELLGIEVARGWLPEVQSTPKDRSDETLLEAKVLELVPVEDAPYEALRRILGRRERMTKPAKELVKLGISRVTPDQLADIRIPFKENLVDLFDAILEGAEGRERIEFLHRICQHTGDVLKCVSGILPKHRYHLRTGQKRAVVKVLESYPVNDFTTNLILSRSKREKSLIVLQYLDYNMYARSDAHKEAVRALRNGELRSWEAQARYLVETGDEGALDFVAARPGMMLRMLRWLLRKGYRDSDIREILIRSSKSLSLHTIADILNALDKAEGREPREELYRFYLDLKKENFQKSMEFYRKQFSEAEVKKRIALCRKRTTMRFERIQRRILKDPACSMTTKAVKLLKSRARYGEILLHYDEVERHETDPVQREHRLRNAEHKHRQALESYMRNYEKARALYEKSIPYNERMRTILIDVMNAHLKEMRTEIYGKKVYPMLDAYDLSRSAIKSGNGSDEGGYLPPGIAIRIPEEVRHLRFFVYWNDGKRVDIDLHAFARDEDLNQIHIGWNADFKKNGIIHSGDITHSDAAEYVDIDLDAPVLMAQTSIHIYSGRNSFKEISTCYVGMMAVKELGEEVKLYDPKNCFFTHELRSDRGELHYGYVDVPGRRLFFVGQEPELLPEYYDTPGPDREIPRSLTLETYLSMLFEAQEVTAAASPEEADVILTMEKSKSEKGVSLADRNFWLDE